MGETLMSRSKAIADRPFALACTDRAMTPEAAAKLLQRNRDELDEELGARIPSAKLSTSLRIQLAWLRSGNACVFGSKAYSFDQRKVIDELAHLEDSGCPMATKPAEQLTGMLKGFWHKHFFEARFMVKNLAEETKKNFDTLWYRDFLKAQQADPALKDESDVGRLTGLIAQTLVHGAILNRGGSLGRKTTSRLTGEWIVYVKHKGQNVYLTLAVHDEPNEAVALRIRQCGQEFPFVLDMLRSNGVEISVLAQSGQTDEWRTAKPSQR
jgi:hypothetical protein